MVPGYSYRRGHKFKPAYLSADRTSTLISLAITRKSRKFSTGNGYPIFYVRLVECSLFKLVWLNFTFYLFLFLILPYFKFSLKKYLKFQSMYLVSVENMKISCNDNNNNVYKNF